MHKLTAAEATALACQRIEKNAATKNPVLDLGYLPLERLPESIGKLGHLASLELSGCSRVSDLSPLTALTGLTSLDLRVCGVSNLSPLTALTGLTALDLSGCGRVSDLCPLTALTGLTALDLSLCMGVSDLSPLTTLIGLTSLNLRNCYGVRNLSPLTVLTGLTSLDLHDCVGVNSLSPLTALTRLTSLNLDSCSGVSDLSPLIALIRLTSLNLSGCKGVRRFKPIQPLLGHLAHLYFHECRFYDLPAHLYGNYDGENVAEQVRRHYEALDTQRRGEDVECKLLVVGNGAAGKTSLVRLILEEQHRDDESSTHAIHLGVWQTDLLLQGNDAPVPARTNVWDFGGQDLYHGTHRLFFQTGAVYLVVWDPWERERPDHNAGEWYADKKRSLQYWIDQIVASDPQARILIVRNKADLDGSRVDPDWREQLPRHQEAINEGRIQFVRLSAKDRSGRYRVERGKLFAWLSAAVAAILGGPDKRAAGQGRLAVKAVVRGWQEENEKVVRSNEVATHKKPLPHPFITRALFDQIVREHCVGSLDAEDTSYVLQWLHRTGVVFWNEALFGERILIDQRWAIQGIYTLLDRELTYPRLQGAHGKFTAAHLARWAWNAAGYAAEEQRLFLQFMQACGLCFLLLKEEEALEGGAVFVAPEYLPDASSIMERRSELRRGLGEKPTVEVCAVHPALGEGVAQAMINRIGAGWSRSAVLWRWGAAFASGDPKINAVAEVSWSPVPGQEREFGGQMHVAVWGADARAFLGSIVATLRKLPPFPNEARFGPCGDEDASPEPDVPILVEGPRLEDVVPNRAEAVGRCVSFSVAGTDAMPPSEACLQESLLEKMKTLANGASYRLLHYQYKPGDPPENIYFLMHEIAKGDLVLIFLSERFLLSDFCMTELVLIYDHGSRRRFPREQTKLWRLPSAAKHLDRKQRSGQGVSAEVIRYWREQLAAYDKRVTAAVGETTGARSTASVYERKKRIDPCWEFFEFLGDEARWNEFLIALTNHAFEHSPLSKGDESKEVVEAFAATMAEEIHTIMNGRDAFGPTSRTRIYAPD